MPDPAALREAEKLVKDIFKDDYAKKGAENRLALARKLLQQAEESRDDAVGRYVLLLEARALATEAGDMPVALRAIEQIVRLYQIDGIALKQATLSALVQVAKTPEEIKPLALALLWLADDAIRQGSYEVAEKAAASAASAAQRAKDVPMATRTQAKSKEAADLRARYDKVKKALEKLASAPDDPAANGTVGQYLCLVRGDWKTGLPHLQKGDDAALKALAEKEGQVPPEGAAQLALADAWWDAAEKSTGRTRETLRNRAAYWYNEACARLTGLNKVRAEKRLAESGALRPAGDWLDVTDGNRFNTPGPKGESLLIIRDNAGWGVKMDPFPAGPFDGVSAVLRVQKSGEDPQGGFILQNKQRAVVINPKRRTVQMLRMEDSVYKGEMEVECPAQGQYVLTVLLLPGEYAVLVDGREKFRVATDATTLDSLELQVNYASIEFDKIALKRKE